MTGRYARDAMELFFRKYFWSVNLLFIMLAALLAARTVNAFLESSILPMPTGQASKAPVRRPPTEALARLDLERVAKLTGLPVPKEPEVAEPESNVDPNAAPVKSGLRVRLLGTLASAVEKWSIASILDMSTLRAQTVAIGDTIQGAEIVSIERERLIIVNNRRREFIDASPGDGAGYAYTPPPAAKIASEPVAVASGIRGLSENEYEVPRPEIDRYLSNLNDVAMQARIVPAFKDGQSQGFKLFSIRPDSLYTKIGIQNGDVIRRINGYDLNSTEKALEIYTKLRDASRIDIEIERNGNNLRKTYNVR
jgi:general secretion pathway protein C